MPLSKERDKARQRNKRMIAKGVTPSPTELLEPLSLNQRKERLAELIATPINPQDIKARDILTAIDIYNKLSHDYQERPVQVNVNLVDTQALLMERLTGNRQLSPVSEIHITEDSTAGTDSQDSPSHSIELQ